VTPMNVSATTVKSVICPPCGCSLVRLGVSRESAANATYARVEHHFCCEGCAATFGTDPDRYLAQIHDIVVCPACLAEKPAAVTVALDYQGRTVNLCGCPGCRTAFERDPERLIARLEDW
jgi:YHS domain-containing protein